MKCATCLNRKGNYCMAYDAIIDDIYKERICEKYLDEAAAAVDSEMNLGNLV